GSHVCREFLDQGRRVTVFDNLSTGLRENLFPEAAFIHGDIMDYLGLLRAVRSAEARGAPFDALIHLAAHKAAGESMLCPEKYSATNISGTINILNAAAETGISRIVFSSSAAVYGEPAYLPIDEGHPVEPENYYGFTKLAIEGFLGWYEKLKGIRYASLRYFNAAGYDVTGRITGLEQNPANLIPVIMEAACGTRPQVAIFGNDYATPDGTGVRDYVHVNDLAAAHAAALDHIVKTGSSIVANLGSETGLSVLDILDAARRISGKPIPAQFASRRPGDPAKLTASAQYAREVLGWKARYSDRDTLIRTTWDAYRKKTGL
ncbi:MAG: UDP-glucose 4-epimerase GalE, partial [Treponema sp.]|nr:UDP-glucose 4-epimerase GalE [Treponema sp.]